MINLNYHLKWTEFEMWWKRTMHFRYWFKVLGASIFFVILTGALLVIGFIAWVGSLLGLHEPESETDALDKKYQ